MKFGIDIGHNCQPDSGAVGIKAENALTMEVGILVINKLRDLGHEVVSCKPIRAETVLDSLRKRVATSNKFNVDLFASIHFNAYNRKAHGTEVFAISEAGKKFARSVLTEICKLGFFNRGVKDKPRWFVLENTIAPAILIECCFCDNEGDMDLFDAEAMASAIALGLTKCIPD